MIKTVLHWAILTLLIFVIYASGALSFKDYVNGDVCPKMIGVPACYVVLLLFIGAFISHIEITKLKAKFFFLFVGIVASVALFGTIGEFTGGPFCPETSNGVPMCFYSLGISTLLLVLKFFEVRASIK